MKVNVNNNLIDVVITKKKGNRNTYLRVKSDLKLYVTTNIFTSDKSIERIINDNIKSIENMYSKQVNKNEINSKFLLLGKEYDIISTNSKQVELGTSKVFIGKDIDIDKWLKKEAQVLFQERLDYWYNKFSRRIPNVTLRIRKMTSRWGVCNTKTHVITLNLELMKKNIECLDYVINHELSHLIYADHSSKFWGVVEENYPNYKEIRKIMKNY